MKHLRLVLIVITMLVIGGCSINYLPQGLISTSAPEQGTSGSNDKTADQGIPVSPIDQAEPTEQSIFQSSSNLIAGLHATDPCTFHLASGQIQLVEFFAFWCTDCQSMSPIVHELESEYKGKLNFVYLDVDDSKNSSVLKQLDASYYIPEFRILDKMGKTIWSYIGPLSREDLKVAIDNRLQK
jgi:thiol-disulfide isomerase/thioredoxin